MKGVGGRYTVETGEGQIIICTARGRLRREGIVPLPGDRVEISLLEDSSGRIETILPRKNVSARPPVANIDKLVIVVTTAQPQTHFSLIDRIIVNSAALSIDPIICINKCDVSDGAPIDEVYSRAGYKTVQTSTVTGAGLDQLNSLISGSVCALSGNSGVGKSSLLNAIIPGLSLPIGEISEKVGRGKHTTRHVELIHAPGGAIIADTPGFSVLDARTGIEPASLPDYFPEFEPFIPDCRFRGCAHEGETDCAVKRAVDRNQIAPSRFESYLDLLKESRKQTSY